MLKLLKWPVYFLGTLIALLILGMLIPRPFNVSGEEPETRKIYLLYNAIHSDIIVPVDDDILARLSPILSNDVIARLGASNYLVFGWGGRSFYLETPRWADIKPLPVLRSFGLDQSVMHIDTLTGVTPDQLGAKKLIISDAGYERLMTFIMRSFDLDEAGQARIAGPGYGNTDFFFEANDYFNAFFGCNTWTSAALRQAGLRTGWWNPIPQSLAISVEIWN